MPFILDSGELDKHSLFCTLRNTGEHEYLCQPVMLPKHRSVTVDIERLCKKVCERLRRRFGMLNILARAMEEIWKCTTREILNLERGVGAGGGSPALMDGAHLIPLGIHYG